MNGKIENFSGEIETFSGPVNSSSGDSLCSSGRNPSIGRNPKDWEWVLKGLLELDRFGMKRRLGRKVDD